MENHNRQRLTQFEAVFDQAERDLEFFMDQLRVTPTGSPDGSETRMPDTPAEVAKQIEDTIQMLKNSTRVMREYNGRVHRPPQGEAHLEKAADDLGVFWKTKGGRKKKK